MKEEEKERNRLLAILNRLMSKYKGEAEVLNELEGMKSEIAAHLDVFENKLVDLLNLDSTDGKN